MMGMGKLGWPVALAIAEKHDVVGYDLSDSAKSILSSRKYPHRETGAQERLEQTTLRLVDTVEEAVAHADVLFVAVQTPHGPLYEGVTRLPETRADFDSSFLRACVASISAAASAQEKKVIVAVISTVLPGTVDREIKPVLNEWTGLVYNPSFIAQSTAIDDYLNPEFVLLGVDDIEAAEVMHEFYGTITTAEVREMSVKSAELCKVAYNVFLGVKITVANAVMQVAHEVGADCDDVTDALAKATSRVVSPRYMRGGMGDGGPCHARDAIALSWLSRELSMGYDFFGDMMETREAQTEWLAHLVVAEAKKRGLQGVVVLGKAYKAGTNLTIGSCATLLVNILSEHAWVQAGHPVVQWDPHVDEVRVFSEAAAFVVATDHPEFYEMAFPSGSVVVDPWGRMKDISHVRVVRVGRCASI